MLSYLKRDIPTNEGSLSSIIPLWFFLGFLLTVRMVGIQKSYLNRLAALQQKDVQPPFESKGNNNLISINPIYNLKKSWSNWLLLWTRQQDDLAEKLRRKAISSYWQIVTFVSVGLTALIALFA
jgi:hypothetical protein